MADPKTMVATIIGGSMALGGLLLIFSGFLFAQAAMMPQEYTRDQTLDTYKRFARLGLWPFAAALALSGIGAFYFLYEPMLIAWIVLTGFTILIVATIVYGFSAARFL